MRPRSGVCVGFGRIGAIVGVGVGAIVGVVALSEAATSFGPWSAFLALSGLWLIGSIRRPCGGCAAGGPRGQRGSARRRLEGRHRAWSFPDLRRIVRRAGSARAGCRSAVPYGAS
ncbi:MAG: hypothetical protein ACR2OB_04010 [Solirubrobacteraceae bacterium]